MNKKTKQSGNPKANMRQDRRAAEQQKQQNQTRIFLIVTAVLVVGLLAGLMYMASRDAARNNAEPEPVAFNYAGFPRLGDENAPVKLVTFSDYQCVYCGQFNQGVKPELVSRFIDNGTAALYSVNMAFLGEGSELAGVAAQSVYQQNEDAFWIYSDAIYAIQGEENEGWVTVDTLVELAESEELDIDYAQLRSDIENKTYSPDLVQNNTLAAESGVESTPTVFVNGMMSFNAFDIEALSAEIEAAAQSAGENQ